MAASRFAPGQDARGKQRETENVCKETALWNHHRAVARRRKRLLTRNVALVLLLLSLPHCSPPAEESFQTRLDAIEALLDQGLDPEAEEAARTLLVEAETSQMPQLRVADVLDLLGIALQRRRRMTQDETWEFARRALQIREEHGAPNDPALVTSLDNLAYLHMSRGEFAETTQLFERALRISEEAGDPTWIGSSQTGLAIVHLIHGRYERAIDGYERALASHASAPTPDELAVASALNGYAMALFEIGDFVGCRDQHERALAIRERLLPPDHPKIAETLNNYGALLFEKGDNERALEFFRRVVNIRTIAYGARHRLVGRVLTNRALAEFRLGELRAAESTARQALEILEENEDDNSIAACCVTLGMILVERGQYDDARTCFERSLAIRQGRAYTDPYVVVTLDQLAHLHYETGDLRAALESIRRSLDLCAELLWTDHPLLATYEARHATILAELGETEAAFEAAVRSEAVRSGHLRITSQALTEREALLYAESHQRGLDVLLRLAASGSVQGQAALERVWDARVRSRAIVLDEMVARSRRLVASGDSAVGRLFEDYRLASTRYANLALRGAQGMNVERYRILLNNAHESKEKAERALATASRAFRTEKRRAALGFDEISSHLPEGSALVAYVTYSEPTRPAAPDTLHVEHGMSRKPENVQKMAALVLADGVKTPRVVPLATQEEIDRHVRRWGAEAALGVAVAGRSHAEAEESYRLVGETLRNAVWDPVTPHLAGAKLVFVVPDASLHRVAFAALPGRDGRFLADAGMQFHYLTSERDLVVEDQPLGSGLVAVGGVDFGGTGTPSVASSSSSNQAPSTSPSAARRASTPCQPFDQSVFPALPATAAEAEEVVTLWQEARRTLSRSRSNQRHSRRTTTLGETVLLTGTYATDAAFRMHASGKRVLHIATHGFFLDDDCAALPSGTRGLKHTGAPSPRVLRRANPLHLSGLAFGGANNRHAVSMGEDDGVLVAEEIAALDLQGVEWAVLSACETGIGRIVSGEGVLGLRRAMQVAGVQTSIMSLWAVGDEPTREWMYALYSARLLDSRTTPGAVHQANTQILGARRERGKGCKPCGACSTHPFYWSAFVSAGNWH